MIDWIRGCLARIGCLTLLVVGVAGAWAYQDDVARWWRDRTVPPPAAEASEELARRAEARLSRLFRGASREIRLEGAEVESLLRYRYAPLLPAGVDDLAVRLGDGWGDLSATLDLDLLAGDRLPGLVRRVVGDSARLTARLTPEVPAPGRLHLRVEELRTGALAIPSAMIPWLLREVGLPVAGEEGRAVELRVGYPLTEARVVDGGLELTREPAAP